MRIQRSFASKVLSRLGCIPRIIGVGSLAVIIAASGAVYLQNVIKKPQTAYAVTPPDTCFATTGTTTKTITNYYNNEGNNAANPACPRAVDIPSYIGGAPVVAIATGGMSAKGLTAVTIPSTMTSLGGYALAYNEITSITIPSSITVIPSGALRQNKLTSVTLHSGVTTISDRAFIDNLLTTIDIPYGVTTIGPRAFYGNQLTSVVIPASVATVDTESFDAMPTLKSIEFKGPVTTFGTSVLPANTIETIIYNGTTYNIADLATPAEQCFAYSGNTITGYKTANLNVLKTYGYPCLSRHIIVPASVGGVPMTTIGDYAMSFRALESATIQAGITTISHSAFYQNSLMSVDIPETVTSIGVYAFSSNKLSTVTLPSGLTTLGDDAFGYNVLQSVTIPSGITTIGARAFQHNRLTEISLPEGITVIGEDAFANNRLAQVTLPASLTTIGNAAFHSNKLTSVTIPDSVITLGRWAFSSNYLSSIIIGRGVAALPSAVFAVNKLTSVIIPANVTSISPAAFLEQNPIGGDMDNDETSPYYLWSSDPSVVQAAYDRIWYAQLYTEDPANPNGLQSATVSEEWWMGYDTNANGTTTDSLGGHVINPSAVTLQYISHSGASLAPSVTRFGERQDGSFIPSYLVKDNVFPAPLDPLAPTAEETAAVQAGFAWYYQAGQQKTFTAPAIAGYTTPAAQAKTLVAGNNNIAFTYQPNIITVDFAGKAAPQGVVSKLITASQLSIDGAGDCSTIQSAQLVTGTGVTAPVNQTILGGIEFTLAGCSNGGTASVTYKLGGIVSDMSKLHIYKKKAADSALTDITKQVTVSSRDGATYLSYHLLDGGSLDEDGLANGTILDPVYVALDNSAAELASTGVNGLMIAAAAAVAVAVAIVVLIKIRRTPRSRVII